MTGQPPSRVVVTGGAGFVGRHLVQSLASSGDRVLVIDDLSSAAPTPLPAGIELEVADIATADLTGLLQRWRPATVYHLAAQTRVAVSMTNPDRDLVVNVVGTRRLLEAAAASGSPTFVFVSSGGAVYGETPRPATERTQPRPSSYYGLHKLFAEHYIRIGRVPWAIARPSNIYGPGQQAGTDGAVIPAFLAAARGGDPLVIHGTGRQVRDFIFVGDFVAALGSIAARGLGATWNVGTGIGTTVLQLADTVGQVVGHELERTHGPRRAGDVTRSILSIERLRRLGWSPEVSLLDGLRETARRVG